MAFDKLLRSADEMIQLGKECIEHEQRRSVQFENLTYEQGIRAALRWLFFSTSDYPLDVKEPREILPDVVHSEVKLD